MTVDPKWLEILKARGPQTAAISAACGLAFWLIRAGQLPSPGDQWITALAVAGLVCGFLALASIGSGVLKVLRLGERIRRWNFNRLSRKRVAAHIPHMSETDRQIIGYLLHRNEKFFTGDFDGGRAATLIAAGIVVPAARPGQPFDQSECPFAIPDVIWEVLSANRDKFPAPDDLAARPWRIPWLER